jgi:Response regulator containing CheY-like receiver, AAA-type ATPase, and DNA-binding domains
MAGRILVLDDEENYASMLQELLRQNNYLVDMATKPELAIAQLEEVPYDLVISDYKMPVMDGADFLKRSRELYPNLPVILVSGLMNTPELVKVANMSVTLVMEKPLNTQAFLKHVARFSTPMTEEEKAASELREAAGSKELKQLPEEPKFYCGASGAGRKAIQMLWNACETNSYAHVFEPTGGDTLMALKDISAWKGYKDLPIRVLKSSDFFGGGVGLAKDILASTECSHIVAIQLKSLEEVSESRLLIEQTLSKFADSQKLFFVFILEAKAGLTFSDFSSNAGANAISIPALKDRPLDVARYTNRFIRMAEDQSATPRKLELSTDAIYYILSQEWSGNYKQLMDVIVETGKFASDVIEAADIASTLGDDAAKVPNAEARFEALLQKAQGRHLVDRVEVLGQQPSKVAQSLQLARAVNHQDDFINLPLIDASLAAL